MTRWKRERTVVIMTMHAHHRWSVWNGCLLDAAESLGLPIATVKYPNHHDGSLSHDWYTNAEAFVKVGGTQALHKKARELHEERLEYGNV